MTDGRAIEGTPKLARYSAVAATFAFIACNGLIVLTAFLALFGITFVVNPHIQAVLISGFSILTLILVYIGYRQHRMRGPLVMAAVGALVIVTTMYVSYNKTIESIGLVALIASAVWSWRVVRKLHKG
jgi:hypothetical protein